MSLLKVFSISRHTFLYTNRMTYHSNLLQPYSRSPVFMKLPPIDHILDLCRTRDDFPMDLDPSARSSLIRQFLLSSTKLSHDGSQQNQRRRHSMFEMNSGGEALEQRKRRSSMFALSCSPKGRIQPWTLEEDNQLAHEVLIHGQNWTLVADGIISRTRRQCKEHWTRVLSKRGILKNEASKQGLWSPEEDYLLLKAKANNGSNWIAIASEVPLRNRNQCEKRFKRIACL